MVAAIMRQKGKMEREREKEQRDGMEGGAEREERKRDIKGRM